MRKYVLATTYREGAITAFVLWLAERSLLDTALIATPFGHLHGRLRSRLFAQVRQTVADRNFESLDLRLVKPLATSPEFLHVFVRKVLGPKFGITPTLMYWVKRRFDSEVSELLNEHQLPVNFVGMWGSCAKSFKVGRGKNFNVLNFVNSRPSHHNKYLSDLAQLDRTHPEMIPERVKDQVEEELALADVILVPSKFVATQMPEYANKISVISYGVDHTRFLPVLRNVPAAGRRNPFTLLFLGQISHRKGIKTLVAAARRARNVEFHLAGPCVSPELITNLPSNVRYLGPVRHKNAPHIFHCSDAFVIPSFEDSYGLVTLEAMATGRPVIVSTNCGSAELITHMHNGLVFEAGNVSELLSCLAALTSDEALCHRIGSAGRKTIEEAHTWDHYCEAVCAEIENRSNG